MDERNGCFEVFGCLFTVLKFAVIISIISALLFSIPVVIGYIAESFGGNLCGVSVFVVVGIIVGTIVSIKIAG